MVSTWPLTSLPRDVESIKQFENLQVLVSFAKIFLHMKHHIYVTVSIIFKFCESDKSNQKCSSRILCWACKTNICIYHCKFRSNPIHIGKFSNFLSPLSVYCMRMVYMFEIVCYSFHFVAFLMNMDEQVFSWKYQGRINSLMILCLVV